MIRPERPPSWPLPPLPPVPPTPSPPPPLPVPWPPPRPEPGPPAWPPGPPPAVPGSGLVLELADRLLARRSILLSGTLDGPAAAAAVARLMLLDADSGERVELHLSCPDGDLAAALVLAEAVDLLRAPVTAMLLGTVGGPVLAVVAAADRVSAHANASLVLREPRTSATGRADELLSAGEQHARQVAELCSRIATAAGRTPDEVAADLRAGRVLDAPRAVEYGLVDELLAPRR
jgi:ATP-dependent Clp protease protease subunit